jgi:hypothetical protein
MLKRGFDLLEGGLQMVPVKKRRSDCGLPSATSIFGFRQSRTNGQNGIQQVGVVIYVPGDPFSECFIERSHEQHDPQADRPVFDREQLPDVNDRAFREKWPTLQI